MAAFKDTIRSNAQEARAATSVADGSSLLDALGPIARLLGRIASRESVSTVSRDTAPQSPINHSDFDAETPKGSRHDPC
jgi:hypothetical protein